MGHDSAVAECPTGAAGGLVADESVFDAEAVVGEFVLVEDVAKLAFELFVLVERDGEESIFDAEGVVVIVAEFVAGDLGGPASKVLAIEKRDPFLCVWFGLLGFDAAGEGCEYCDGEEGEDYTICDLLFVGHFSCSVLMGCLVRW